MLNAGLFPNATLLDCWATYQRVVGEEHHLWEDHPDAYEIVPGITVYRTAGHTFQDASLAVVTFDEACGTRKTVVFTHAWWLNSDGSVFSRKGLRPS